jgi:CPA1 family monovalent cation:H+ antiporter
MPKQPALNFASPGEYIVPRAGLSDRQHYASHQTPAFCITQDLMPSTGIHAAELILLLLLLFVVAFAALAQKLKTPYPIVLVVAGLLLGFVPHIPKITLDPELVFLVILPPLLYSAAWLTSWQEFCRNLVSIASLAIGLVAFTVLGVAAASWLTGFDWRIGFVLGAVVATTDAIAATSIAKRVGLPKRIVDVLEGESLVNDATGLLALEFAIAIVVYSQTPTISSAILRLVYLIAVGIAIGIILGRVVEWFEHRINDGPIEIAVSIFVPYAAYLAAEAVHGSGVLAVVAAGLYLGHKSSRLFSPNVRLQANAVWDALVFILNGVVFVVIGLQLPYVWRETEGIPVTKLLLYSGLFSALLILLRLLWTFPSAHVAYAVHTRLLHQNQKRLGTRELFVVGWTGMRGVVALAAAISLPQTLANGALFPHRSLIVFLTFSVILVTLVLQGLTLPTLIRALGLAGASGPPIQETEARRAVLEATLQYLESQSQRDLPAFGDLYDDLKQHYKHRLAGLGGTPGAREGPEREHYARYLDLSREILDKERQTILRLRDEGRINDGVLRRLEHELDLNETRLNAAIHNGARD